MRNRLPDFLPDSDTIKTDIVIEPSLAGHVPELLARIGFAGKSILVVCDEYTHAAYGARLMGELFSLKPRLLILGEKIHADEASLALLRSLEEDVLLAVGSGTISDLCKFASFIDNRPYAVFPTAPSMNGYLSLNASLTLEGVKESHTAHLPQGVFCDLGILAAAPLRLIKSGLGDSLCRPTAQADWLLSHLLLETPYTSRPFEMLKPYEAELFANADRLITRDTAVIELLMKTLLASGLGMTLSGGSYPASEGEHMIAHTMEMKHGDKLPPTLHGEQIGVTTLTMAGLQRQRLMKPLRLPKCPNWEDALINYFGTVKGKHIGNSVQAKYRLYDRLDALNAKLEEHGDEIREKIMDVTLPETRLRTVLALAEAPTAPAALGWNETDYDIAVSRARFTRDRFTFLDLL